MVIAGGGLPPLNGLVAFEAVARHLSFTAAARDLRVTQAAISQQVKALEAHLGVGLVRRERPVIGLTAEGELLAAAVRTASGPSAESAFLRMATNRCRNFRACFRSRFWRRS